MARWLNGKLYDFTQMINGGTKFNNKKITMWVYIETPLVI